MKNKKKFVIFGIVLLVLAVFLAVIFASKINKNKKAKDNKNNYTIKFDYYEESRLTQRVSFIYSNKRLKNVTLSLYFDSKETAKNASKIYKESKEYKDCKVVKNALVLYYLDKDIIDYKAMSEDEISDIYISDGFVKVK
ncbi:MAG: hypothetical protein IKX00_00245 [Bacilli bacterium]|nr:hypothetical protein [Bacilli bacterium]